MSELVPLRAGDLAVDIAPAVGAAITAFSRGPSEIFRPTPPTAIGERKVRQTSSFPLIPYSNRIADGRFSFGGETFELAKNFGDHPHPVHGNAWQREWRVERAEPSEASFSLEHDPERDGADEWPFAYRAVQDVVLEPECLTIRLSVENRDRRRMPAGFGLHPYFIRQPGASLRFNAGDVWRTDERSLPSERMVIPADWDYSTMREMAEMPPIDNCFSGWDGSADIRYPQENVLVAIEADPVFGHLVVYRPKGRDYFAVEPVSNMTDAIHHMDDVPDHGLAVLEPGGRLEGTVRFRIGTLR